MRLIDHRKSKGLTLRQAAAKLAMGRETYRRYELAADNPAARVPDRGAMARIFAWSAGAVTPNDFHDLPEPESGVANGGAPEPGRNEAAPP